MKVKMLKTVNGTVDGERMGPYIAEREYDLDDSRARLFIGSAMAEEVVPPTVVDITETESGPALVEEVIAPVDEPTETPTDSTDRPRRGRRFE